MERVKLDFPDEALIHRHPLAVRVTDMNYGRHLGHDALVSLLHEARLQALLALDLPEWDLAGYPSVVADLAVQYQSEAHCPEMLVVETAVPIPEGKALTVYHRVLKRDLNKDNSEQVVATARLNLLLIDPAGGRPVAVPEAVKQALSNAQSKVSEH
ncbi:thioesterase family protein [Halomonas vilamensis]|uniref:Thioesterase family protein n=1 Tax=Vreelandella vilamensis TaxID=531309 RepID=A0ABU1H454_9GAMM|nr:thioesterase family protein [Halomonas vilamensis]MDR5899086.1 thioesterase family protein [Halomonas vilamensis]